MRQFFYLLFFPSVVFIIAACSKNDHVEEHSRNEMEVNGQSGSVAMAMYYDYPRNTIYEPHFSLILYKESENSSEEFDPNVYVMIDISESLIGKNIDLARSLGDYDELVPTLSLLISSKRGQKISIYYFPDSVDLYLSGDSPENVTISKGQLYVSRLEENKFVVEFSLILSDRQSSKIAWQGSAIEEIL